MQVPSFRVLSTVLSETAATVKELGGRKEDCATALLRGFAAWMNWALLSATVQYNTVVPSTSSCLRDG